jgi:hypothetical protein
MTCRPSVSAAPVASASVAADVVAPWPAGFGSSQATNANQIALGLAGGVGRTREPPSNWSSPCPAACPGLAVAGVEVEAVAGVRRLAVPVGTADRAEARRADLRRAA